MSDFLTSLVSRSLGTAPVVRPRLPSLFEPVAPYIDQPFAIHADRDEGRKPHRDNAREDAGPSLLQPNERQTPVSKRRSGPRVEPNVPGPLAPLASADQLEPHPVSRRHRNPPAPPADSTLRDEQSVPSVITPGEHPSQRVPASAKPLPKPLANDVAPQPTVIHSAAQTPAGVVPRMAVPPPAPSPPAPTLNPPIEARTKASPQPDQTIRSEAKSSILKTAPPPTRFDSPRPIPAVEPRRAPHFEFARHITAPPPVATSEPIIQVTIGRIEVRAVPEKTTTPKERHASPVMSLNDYLRSRQGGT